MMRPRCRLLCWPATSTAVLFGATFGVILPYLCSDWGYSSYFSESKWPQDILTLRAVKLNHDRLTEAEAYLSGLHAQQTLAKFQEALLQNPADIAVVVVTIPREHPKFRLGYLTQTIAKLIQIYKADTGSDVFPNRYLLICNTHENPDSHTEAIHLSRYVPYRVRYSNKTFFKSTNKFEKEKQDYVFCLQEALRHHPKYVVILEDDVIPNPHTFRILQHHLKRPWLRDTKTESQPLAFLKLYYPQKWQGYGNDPRHVLELLSVGSLGGLLFDLCFNWVSRGNRTRMMPAKRTLTYLLGAIYFILLAVLTGRQYVLDLRWTAWQLSLAVPAPDCCTQGILYSASMAKNIIGYLENVTCRNDFAVDLAMDAFVKSKGYRRLLVEPNLLTHIGMISSVRFNSKNPKHFIY